MDKIEVDPYLSRIIEGTIFETVHEGMEAK